MLRLLAASTAVDVSASPTPVIAATNINEIAEAYVKLVLAIGQHDPDYVDAYYGGPPEWKKQPKKSLVTIALEAARLRATASVHAENISVMLAGR